MTPNVSAPSVALRDSESASFAESNLPPAMRAEWVQYDKLFTQLQDEAKGIYKRRVREVVSTVAPPREAE